MRRISVQRHYVSLRAFIPIFVIWDNGIFIICCPFGMNMCSSFAAVHCISSERWPGVGFGPLERCTGVFRVFRNTLYPIVGSL